MSRARHHKRENGGAVKPDWNAGEEQNAAKEAEEKKRGGRVHGEGHGSKHRADRPKRAKGGAVTLATGGAVSAKARGGAVPGRARGGGVGADMKPMTTAANVKHVTKGETPESGDDKVM